MVAGSLALIIVGSYGIVHATLSMAAAWGVPDGEVGSLILAPLTAIPNGYIAAQLALREKGAAVVSETLNSNTINMVVGIAVPAALFGVSSGPTGPDELWWLLGLTAVALILAITERALTRKVGVVIITLYLAFVLLRVSPTWGNIETAQSLRFGMPWATASLNSLGSFFPRTCCKSNRPRPESAIGERDRKP